MSDVAGESPTLLGLALTACPDLLEGDVRLFRHGGASALVASERAFFSFSFLSLFFRAVVARVDVPIRLGGV